MSCHSLTSRLALGDDLLEDHAAEGFSGVIIIGMARPKQSHRTMLFDLWEINYFADYTDHEFAVWLAGFFDGEGCVHLPPKTGIEVTIANTDINVIYSIHRRLGIGTLEEVTFSNENWRTKYCWRIRRADEAATLFRHIRLYSTIKADAIDRAMERIIPIAQKRASLDERNDEALALAAEGVPYPEIARRLKMSRTRVGTLVYEAKAGKGRIGRRARKEFSSWTEKGAKAKANVTTTSTRLSTKRSKAVD